MINFEAVLDMSGNPIQYGISYKIAANSGPLWLTYSSRLDRIEFAQTESHGDIFCFSMYGLIQNGTCQGTGSVNVNDWVYVISQAIDPPSILCKKVGSEYVVPYVGKRNQFECVMKIIGTDAPVYNMQMEPSGRQMPLGMDVVDGQAYLATAPEDVDYINFQFDLST
jgi:hypothetical protein